MWKAQLKRERAEAMASALRKAYQASEKSDSKLVELASMLEIADQITIK